MPIVTIPKADLPAAKPGDTVTLTGQVTANNGDMIEIDADIQPAAEEAAEAKAPGSFDEMEKQMANERAI